MRIKNGQSQEQDSDDCRNPPGHHTTLNTVPAPKPGFIANTTRIAQGEDAGFFTTLIGTFHANPLGNEPPEKTPAMANMSVHLWRLENKEEDCQIPHKEDEIYYIVEGAGEITIGGDGAEHPGRSMPVSRGDVVFVPRSTWHRFHDFDEHGLLILVFFAPNFTDGTPW